MAGKRKVLRENEAYYVSVRKPTDTRRHILESAKKSLMSMQNYHRLLLIRQEKHKHLEILKQSVKELSYLNNRLSKSLPEYDRETMGSFISKKHPSKNLEKQASKRAEKKEEAPPRRESTELERLEESLNSIEERLRDLD